MLVSMVPLSYRSLGRPPLRNLACQAKAILPRLPLLGIAMLFLKAFEQE